ncbi:MAG TPA: hypothetical protein VNJ52_05065 [Patescibacteria group bacterium]|nr:hypothetical protein [Patescibacteria group bacterium]
MAKFKMRLKLQGLELEVDGERQDIPLITAAVAKELSSIVEPIDVLAEGKQIGNGSRASGNAETDSTSRRSRRRSTSRSGGETAAPVEFRHDSAKFGGPVQGWSVTERCIWLLYVLREITGVKEYSAAQLVATFNENFKAAGKLHPPLLSRELAKAKVLAPAPVGEDKGQWYLTDEGERQAKELVAKSLGG